MGMYNNFNDDSRAITNSTPSRDDIIEYTSKLLSSEATINQYKEEITYLTEELRNAQKEYADQLAEQQSKIDSLNALVIKFLSQGQ